MAVRPSWKWRGWGEEERVSMHFDDDGIDFQVFPLLVLVDKYAYINIRSTIDEITNLLP